MKTMRKRDQIRAQMRSKRGATSTNGVGMPNVRSVTTHHNTTTKLFKRSLLKIWLNQAKVKTKLDI